MKKVIDMGGGFFIQPTDMKTWTQYRAYHSVHGRIIDERAVNFSRRRDAEKQIADWKKADVLAGASLNRRSE